MNAWMNSNHHTFIRQSHTDLLEYQQDTRDNQTWDQELSTQRFGNSNSSANGIARIETR